MMYRRESSRQQSQEETDIKEPIRIQAQDSNIITLFGLIQPQQKQTLKPKYNNDFQYIARNTILSGRIDEKRRQKMIKQNRAYNPQQVINITLSNCLFILLKELYLDRSEISSIEFIGYMDAVNLTKLYLDSNFITNFNALNKTNFKHLESINVEDNPSGAVINFQRMKVQRILGNVLLQQSQDYNVIMQDLSQLVKLQSLFIYFLQIRGQKRIRQKKLHQKLKQKYRDRNLWGEMQKIYIYEQQEFNNY